mgnify:FL=1
MNRFKQIFGYVDWEGLVFILVILLLIFLFMGSPDIFDLIKYKLSDGKIPLPE